MSGELGSLRLDCMGALLVVVYTFIPVKAYANSKVAPDAHAACLEARDYSGCVNTFQNGAQQETTGEKCWISGKKRCLAGDGSDRFGMPKIASSIYEYSDNGSIRYFVWDGDTRDENSNPRPTVFLCRIKIKKDILPLCFD